MDIPSARFLKSRAGAWRRTEYAPWPTSVYLLVVFFFMGISATLAWPQPEMAFRSDNSPVSWLSAAQLWAMSVLAIRLAAERVLPVAGGLWLGLAMAGMAFDEQFMFHEQWKYGCAAWVGICRYGWARELPMLMSGVLGVLTAVWLHRALPRGLARVQLWGAIAVGLFALGQDLVGLVEAFAPYEEAFEVVAEALFAGLFLGLRHRGLRAVDGGHEWFV